MAPRHAHSLGSRAFDVANHLVILAIAMTALYPFLHMAALSTSDFFAVGFGKVNIIPVGFNLSIYGYLFQYNPFIPRAYFNSVLYTVSNTLFTVVLCSMAGFALAQRKLAFRGLAGTTLLVSMFFSGGLIPTFLWLRQLGMLNTLWAIVLPSAVSAYYIFLFRVYIHSNLPEELLESVYMDGGGDFLAFFRIALPLIKPMVATIGLFAAVAMWNSFFSALVYLRDQAKYPLTLFLRQMVIISGFGGASRGGPAAGPQELTAYEAEGMFDASQEVWQGGYLTATKMAFTLLTVVPILFVYPFAQRYFVKGITLGSVKG